MGSGYNKQAKPGVFNGHKYASQMEIKLAKLLDKHRIRFKPHVKFNVFHRNGDEFTYEVDFQLKYDHRFSGISKPVRFLEIKGALGPHDIRRLEALKYRTGKYAFIVLPGLLDYWMRCGFNPKRKQG